MVTGLPGFLPSSLQAGLGFFGGPVQESQTQHVRG